MRTACVITVFIASLSYALPTEFKRTPILGLLESGPNSIGKDPLTMIKALPDNHIDPSPLGVDNMVSGLGLPDLGLKRGLAGLDDLIGMTGLNRKNPLGSPITEGPGDAVPVLNSFIPLDMMGSPVKPGSKGMGLGGMDDVPVVGGMEVGLPVAPVEGLIDSLGAGGILKRMEKKSRKLLEKRWSGADELNDITDAPYWG